MNRYRPIIILVAALLLGGCAEGLAGFGGSILSTVGGGISDSYETKKKAIEKWRVLKDQNFAKQHDEMRREANRLLDEEGTREKGMKMLKEIDKFLDDNQPLWLIQQYIRSKRGGEAEPAP